MKVCLVSLIALAGSTNGFSIGAGRCVVGEAAPSSTHLLGDPELGSLADGGYTITVNGETVTEAATVASVGGPFDVEVSGPDFRGVLIMVANQPDSVIVPGSGLALNVVGTGCIGTASITHTGSELKQSAAGTITLPSALETTLEINVVVQNSGGISTFYYTQIALSVVEPVVPATEPPTAAPAMPETDPPTAAPVMPDQLPETDQPTAAPAMPVQLPVDCVAQDHAMDACMDNAGLTDIQNTACDTCLNLAALTAAAISVTCDALSSGDSSLCTALDACLPCPEACSMEAEAYVLCEVNEELGTACPALVCEVPDPLPETNPPTAAPVQFPDSAAPVAYTASPVAGTAAPVAGPTPQPASNAAAHPVLLLLIFATASMMLWI